MNNNRYQILKLTIAMLVGGLQPVWAQNAQSYDPEKVYEAPKEENVRERIARWQDLKFGLFMHWGTYSEWGIVESWSLCPEDHSFTQRTGPYASDWATYKKAYEHLQTTFNPAKFNPGKWARAARAGGMRYMVFTAKHHDGFCMYDTRYSDYKITSKNTPFSTNPNADVTKAIFNAFRDQNFMVGAYFSKPDWHSQDYWWSYFPPKNRSESYDRDKYPERWKRFTQYTYNQIEELVTNYGGLDLLWFDGDWAKMDMTDIVRMARKDQPGIIIVDRHGKPEYVNYLTPEQKVPDHYIASPWETCMTLGQSWSYIKDEVYKPSRQLIQLLVDIVAKNGNLLLDIGPGPDGEWHQEAYDRLADMGKWININGESIYGTKPVAPYRQQQWAFTTREHMVYATYLPTEKETEIPAKLTFPASVLTSQKKMKLLGTTTLLKWKAAGGLVTVVVPEAARKQLSGQAAWVFKAY